MSLLTEEIRALVGKEVSYTAPEELGRASIRYFARAVGDDNPLYTDDAYARRHGYDGVIAPPTLVCETNQYADVPPDPDGYAGHDWHIEIPGTRKVRGGNTYTFHRPVRPGDVVTATWRLTGIAERRTSGGQEMLVVSSAAEYTDQQGRLLVTNEETIIFVALKEER
ncbi:MULTISPECIES: MaoC family dehydratase N-terminal domain-containing protein [unclassified Microbispora]|uniref:FAS1-like dehydratase domain-containing protein n=1 Tax=unclassified Microbispora TaxID=2614687 RepID=UPI00147560BA|nr:MULTISPECIES: MaoC family dehydratase N-terminal domain-containing protein [unclassified Microbispora]